MSIVAVKLLLCMYAFIYTSSLWLFNTNILKFQEGQPVPLLVLQHAAPLHQVKFFYCLFIISSLF